MKKWLSVLVLTVLLSGCTDPKAGRKPAMEWPDPQEAADTAGVGQADGDGLLEEEEPVPVAADELFDDFIFNFAGNRKLQMERIQFPLPVTDGEQQEHIQRKAWQMEHFFMQQDYYTLIFDTPEQMELLNDTALTDVVVEKIFMDEHTVRQYQFSRQAGRWTLTEIRNQTLPRNPNAQFLNFYERFATDSVFQRESLSEQIAFVGPDPDDDFAQMEGVITPDFWDAFKPELPQGMLFNVVYGQHDPAATQKIFVIRGIANGLEVELTFRLHNGRWKLTKMIT